MEEGKCIGNNDFAIIKLVEEEEEDIRVMITPKVL